MDMDMVVKRAHGRRTRTNHAGERLPDDSRPGVDLCTFSGFACMFVCINGEWWRGGDRFRLRPHSFSAFCFIFGVTNGSGSSVRFGASWCVARCKVTLQLRT